MAKKISITHEELLKALEYNPATGIFRWKWRDNARKCLNTRMAGKVAGCLTSAGYWCIKINSIWVLGHQLAWFYVTGEWAEDQIDHKNGRKSENWFENLQKASTTQNMQNLAKYRGTSKYIGVSWSKQRKKWVSHICSEGKRYHLGFFEKEEDAAQAYLSAKARLHTFNPIPRKAAV
jgi:hypothetical protein